MNKRELLKECVAVLKTRKVNQWYKENLEGNSQGESINSLEVAVSNDKLSIREALSVALVVGIQWDEKFKGVP